MPHMNYHRVNDRLVTGGHFVDDGLAELKAQGVTVVVVEGVDENEAAKDLHAVWTPGEENQKWADYIEEIKASML